jgi:hypothetical protein
MGLELGAEIRPDIKKIADSDSLLLARPRKSRLQPFVMVHSHPFVSEGSVFRIIPPITVRTHEFHVESLFRDGYARICKGGFDQWRRLAQKCRTDVQFPTLRQSIERLDANNKTVPGTS